MTASKLSVFVTTQARWRAGEDKSAPGFGRSALAIVWDFADLNPFADAGGDWEEMTIAAEKVIAKSRVSPGQIISAAAQDNSFPVGCVVSTDPPYYDNVLYAYLSDYFYVWLRRSF